MRIILYCIYGLMITSCKGDVVENSTGRIFYEFTCDGKSLVAITGVRTQVVKNRAKIETHFELIGPLAIIDKKNTGPYWSKPFTTRNDDGVWKTNDGDLLPGMVYYVEIGKSPKLLGSAAIKNANVSGEWSFTAGGGLLLAQIFGHSDADNDSKMRIKLLQIFNNQKMNPRTNQ